MKTNKTAETIENVEQLVAFALRNTYHEDTRFSLECWVTSEYVDDAAYAAWNAAEPEYVCSDESEEKRNAYTEAYNEWRQRRPEMKRVERWSLQWNKSDHWRSNSISLGVELGQQLDKLWKHGPAYQGDKHNSKRNGTMTLNGMLKRLGAGDVSERVNNAKRIERERIAIRNRNSFRREVARLAKELLTDMERGAAQGCKWPLTIHELAQMDSEAYREDEASVK